MNLPKRDIGIQHLLNVNEETDMTTYGDSLGDEVVVIKKRPVPDGKLNYLYNVD